MDEEASLRTASAGRRRPWFRAATKVRLATFLVAFTVWFIVLYLVSVFFFALVSLRVVDCDYSLYPGPICRGNQPLYSIYRRLDSTPLGFGDGVSGGDFVVILALDLLIMVGILLALTMAALLLRAAAMRPPRW